jgi:hypothetical protein
VSFGVADGVGGWAESGVDPSLYAQTLMYHAHRYSRTAWAGEPETDPTQEYEERERVEGWELSPYDCLELAYHGVLRERLVEAGLFLGAVIRIHPEYPLRFEYCLLNQSQLIYRHTASGEVGRLHYRRNPTETGLS